MTCIAALPAIALVCSDTAGPASSRTSPDAFGPAANTANRQKQDGALLLARREILMAEYQRARRLGRNRESPLLIQELRKATCSLLRFQRET
jgi:hypothetical protein